ncbi:MAG: type II toxin-antitoxin system prevent-host-death family antitoxin [Chloroflexota bacterium]|nr:MAG: type II toxin-antitoxin system prevent-host-death family antitoxin [Chloroflexota bacterium]
MRTIGAYAAKTHLPRLLDEVAAGETITITKRGTPVALLIPPPQSGRSDLKEAFARWKETRREVTLGSGETIRQLIEQGRP